MSGRTGRTPDPSPWTRLWNTGVLHSCNDGIKGNYDGPLREFWHAAFARLSDNARVVDLGTGNGAIPLLAKAYATTNGRCFILHGIDIADIAPHASSAAALDGYSGIEFHPGTSITKLPFPDRSVDLITSQFAFEYAPRAEALREVLRVLAPQGIVAMVLHSRDSVVARVANQQLEACGILFGETGFISHARSLLEVLANARSPEQRQQLRNDPRAEAARRAFNDSATRLMDAIDRLPGARMLVKAGHFVQSAILRASDSATQALTDFDKGVQSLEDEQRRLLDLRDALLDQDEVHALAQSFRSAGLNTVETSVLNQAGHARMGWSMVATHG